MIRSTPFLYALSLLCVPVLCVPFLGACSTPGVPGSSAVTEVPITGTIFTIVFENHSAGVINPRNPYLQSLADRYATAGAYLATTHPSLPNYLLMTSGSTQGVGDDRAPAFHRVEGNDNLGAQLDAANVPWRAYMESMGEPCRMATEGEYIVRHNPFVYYTSLSDDTERCREHIVDMDEHLAADLEANTYRFMWITPNICNDMHNCPASTSDEWLSQLIPRLMDSPGYREGGAIFLLWDEGGPDISYVVDVPQTIPFVLISENLVSPGFVSNIRYGHDSYLATVEDAFGIPRLPTTVDSTPMVDFFFGDMETFAAASGGELFEADASVF